MPVPARPKIYHICHVDRLASIVAGGLLSDAEVQRLAPPGTIIGMSNIKQRRLTELTLTSHDAVAWAQVNGRRWAFTLSNAGSRYFEDRADLARLGEIDWDAVEARQWSGCKERKQAEFLMEHSFPWHLIERIGVYSAAINTQVAHALPVGGHRPPVAVLPAWYY